MTDTTPVRTKTDSNKCIARLGPERICGETAVVSFKAQVPGGTLRGTSCARHPEIVRRMVNEETARRASQPS